MKKLKFFLVIKYLKLKQKSDFIIENEEFIENFKKLKMIESKLLIEKLMKNILYKNMKI